MGGEYRSGPVARACRGSDRKDGPASVGLGVQAAHLGLDPGFDFAHQLVRLAAHGAPALYTPWLPRGVLVPSGNMITQLPLAM